MSHIEFTKQSPDNVAFYFQGWQPDTSPRGAVCLVHGLGEHTGRYAHVAAALNAAGYAVLGFDLRGHGKSGGPRGHTPTYDTLMDDIGRLLDETTARYPGKPQFLYGHSLGGNLVLNYALRRKPRIAGVVATSPAIRVTNPLPAVQVALAKVMNKLQPGMQMANGLALDGLARDPEVIRAYTSDPLVHNKISVRLAMGMLQTGEWALAHAAEFTLPLLLVHGSADKLTSAAASQEFAAKVRGDCTLKVWEGFYHETHNEPEKADVLRFMVDWLRAHTTSG
ncbi:MAG: lysophospholipase [Chloroflexi bacterium]|nr:lysophospholipase [Chloroflexota bacterium]